MRTTTRTLAVATSALVLAACSSTASSTATGASTAPNVAPTAVTSAPSTPTDSTSPEPTVSGVANSFDPCQMVTQSEASTLTGVTLGPGQEKTTDNGGKLCVYNGQGHSFTVSVAQASDATAAQAVWDKEQAMIQANVKQMEQSLPANVKVTYAVTSISGLTDRAASIAGTVSFMGRKMGTVSIFLLKGPVFVHFGDLTTTGTVASVSSMVSQAQSTVGRMG